MSIQSTKIITKKIVGSTCHLFLLSLNLSSPCLFPTLFSSDGRWLDGGSGRGRAQDGGGGQWRRQRGGTRARGGGGGGGRSAGGGRGRQLEVGLEMGVEAVGGGMGAAVGLVSLSFLSVRPPLFGSWE